MNIHADDVEEFAHNTTSDIVKEITISQRFNHPLIKDILKTRIEIFLADHNIIPRYPMPSHEYFNKPK